MIGPKAKKRKLRAARKHAFTVTDVADHAETPVEAFEDIVPILTAIARDLGKSPKSLKIYDPFFCHGGTTRKLRKLGFENVYNKNEDWYAVQANRTVPDYDVLLTNPPFSADHIEKLLAFCHSSKKPWLLLQPAYVMGKSCFKSIMASCHVDVRPADAEDEGAGMLYIVPETRYTFLAPPWLYGCRKKTAPFVTMWYCRLPQSMIRYEKRDLKHNGGFLVNQLRNSKPSRRLHVEKQISRLPHWAQSDDERK